MKRKATHVFIFAILIPNFLTPASFYRQQEKQADSQLYRLHLPLVIGLMQVRGSNEWLKVQGLPADDWVRDIAVSPAAPYEILIAFRDLGIYKSVDNGQNWGEVYGHDQANDPSARQIAFSPSNPDIVYATVINNVLRSDDRGNTWEKIWPASNPGGGWALAVDYQDPDHVFIGINADSPDHVYETRDGGLTWEPENLSLGELEGIISLAIDPKDANRIFAGANTDVADHPIISRVYITEDGGDSWNLLEGDFPGSKRVTDITFNPCNPSQIFISRQKHGKVDQYIRRSDDNGVSWNIVEFFDEEVSISNLPPCPVYTALQRSVDGGLTWEDISYNFNSLLPDREEVIFSAWAINSWDNILWVGTREHGLFFISLK